METQGSTVGLCRQSLPLQADSVGTSCIGGLRRPALFPLLVEILLQYRILWVPKSEITDGNNKHRGRDICRRRVSAEDAAITVGLVQGGICLSVTDGAKGASYPTDNVNLSRNLLTRKPQTFLAFGV